jgi:hypothetical protein
VNLAVGPKTFRPSPIGKWATACYILTTLVVMYFNYRGETSVMVDVAVYTSLALTLVSAADYAFRFRRLIGDPGD